MTEHIFVDYSNPEYNQLECKICGKVEKLEGKKMPMSKWISSMNDFEGKHRDCKQTKLESEVKITKAKVLEYNIEADTEDMKGQLGVDSKDAALQIISGLMHNFDIDQDELNF
jgi:hypothetical protein